MSTLREVLEARANSGYGVITHTELRTILDEHTEAGYGKLADAWDEGYRAGWSNRTRSIMGGFNYGQEVANTTPNPYRTKP